MYKQCREDGWYFFVRNNWSPRAVGNGYWKLEKERHEPLQQNIDSSSAVKCKKIPFKYVEKQKQPGGDSKVWKMHEYSIPIPDAEPGKPVSYLNVHTLHKFIIVSFSNLSVCEQINLIFVYIYHACPLCTCLVV